MTFSGAVIRKSSAAFALASSLLLSACFGGGGGGGGTPNLVAPPPPPTPPPPTPPPATPPGSTGVTIFASPEVGEYGSVGVWSNVGEWVERYPTTPSANARMDQVEGDPEDQPRVRYTSNGTYEIQLPGEAFQGLVFHRNVGAPSANTTLFETADNRAVVSTSGSRNDGYRYSESMWWWRPDLDWAFTADFGATAFGLLTPAGSVPVTGSATYKGNVDGISDAKSPLGTSNDYFLLPTEGTVTLAFDFSRGNLSGAMHLILNEGMSWRDLGSFTFDQTLFSPGSTGYSGRFASNLEGFNFFSGRFTGPNAEETIGSWAVPFSYQGATHQAIGAWIAKREP